MNQRVNGGHPALDQAQVNCQRHRQRPEAEKDDHGPGKHQFDKDEDHAEDKPKPDHRSDLKKLLPEGRMSGIRSLSGWRRGKCMAISRASAREIRSRGTN